MQLRDTQPVQRGSLRPQQQFGCTATILRCSDMTQTLIPTPQHRADATCGGYAWYQTFFSRHRLLKAQPPAA